MTGKIGGRQALDADQIAAFVRCRIIPVLGALVCRSL